MKISIITLTLTVLCTASNFSAAHANHAQYDMQVDGLTCPFCVATSSKALKKIDGVYDVTVNLDTGIISVCASKDTDLNADRMTKLFRKKGFTYRNQTVSTGCDFVDISHSETGENLVDVTSVKKDKPKEPHESHGNGSGYGSGHDGDGS